MSELSQASIWKKIDANIFLGLFGQNLLDCFYRDRQKEIDLRHKEKLCCSFTANWAKFICFSQRQKVEGAKGQWRNHLQYLASSVKAKRKPQSNEDKEGEKNVSVKGSNKVYGKMELSLFHSNIGRLYLIWLLHLHFIFILLLLFHFTMHVQYYYTNIKHLNHKNVHQD